MSTTLSRILRIAPAVIMIAAVGMLASCKPSEKSYREAYERAVSGKKAAESEYLDSAARANMQQMGRPERYPAGTDTLLCHADIMNVARGEGLPQARLHPLYVVTGTFKQVFNARELLRRVQSNGFPDAVVLKSRDRRYLTAIPAGDSPGAALDTLRLVQSTPGLGLRTPNPWVLRVVNSHIMLRK